MDTVTCIKTVTTKTGKTFEKGQSYKFCVYPEGIRVFVSDFVNALIRKESTFNKYFK